MVRQRFLSFHQTCANCIRACPRPHIPWIESPLCETDGEPHLYRHSDATPIELFFDLFLVANLSTFTATHEINSLESLWAYVGFLGVSWFTWLQIMLFDIRFARDSIFERTCKALQLGAMIGFVSAGSSFASRALDENLWAFLSLSLLLATTRLMLAWEYLLTAGLTFRKLQSGTIGLSIIAATLSLASVVYSALYFAFRHSSETNRSHIWMVWCALLIVEASIVLGVSNGNPSIGLEDTHLRVRMGLLTLIIIGEGVITITRIVTKTVGGGGWTQWSLIRIMGVTTTVYLLWQAYFDISPRVKYGAIRQQIWTQLHFPLHVALILLTEASQIIALTLDVTVKLRHLKDTINFACEEPRPDTQFAITLLNNTITDMEINYNRAHNQENSIRRILESLRRTGFLCEPDDSAGIMPTQLLSNLTGNVTTALFSSMKLTPPRIDPVHLENRILMMEYVKFFEFVYLYYFVVASITMFLFATFVLLTLRHPRPLFRGIAAGTRILLALFLLSLTAFVKSLPLTYKFMTSPIILFIFPLTLVVVLLVDGLLDWLAITVHETHVSEEDTGDSMQVAEVESAISDAHIVSTIAVRSTEQSEVPT